MATKKKAKKKKKATKKSASKKATPRKSAKRPKKVAKKKTALTVAPKNAPKKALSKKPTRKKRGRSDTAAFSPESVESRRRGESSGDSQGLSRDELVDSESVDELIEEGNAFEAGVVSGVERAENDDEKEVRTHEVPEDDVPGEYLDKD
jgi:hypothetical protein